MLCMHEQRSTIIHHTREKSLLATWINNNAMNSLLWGVLSIIAVLLHAQASLATTLLTSPTGTICPGGSVTFQCTTSGTGQLIWTIDGVSAGVFNTVSDNIGAAVETIQGVTATLTAENEAQSTLTSSLDISSAGVVVESGATITCSDAVTSGNTQSAELLITSIDLLSVEAVYVNFGSARVSVSEFSFPGLTECTRDVLYQTVPNVFGVASPPGPAVGGGATLTVRNLDFCTTNYSFLLTPVSIHNVNGTTTSTNVISGNREDVGPARLFTSPGRVNWLTFSSSAYTDFCGSFASVELAWAPDNSLLFTQSDIFISGTIVMQSTLVDAGFPFCVSTEIVVSPCVQSLGVLRGSQSGSANYTAMPLDFTGPVNLRGTPIFTHINGSVTRVMINLTWDVVEAQTFGGTFLDNSHFTCSFDDRSEMCSTTTSHSFSVSTPEALFQESFSVSVRIDYLNCTDFTSTLVSDTITSLPVIGGMDGSIELRVEVNTSVIGDGTSAQIVFTPTSDMSASAVTTTTQVSGGVLFVQTPDLSPDTDYSYTLTFEGIEGTRLGGIIQGVFRTNRSEPPPQANDIFFELRGQMYLNNSAVSIADVGEGRRALFCRTNSVTCCRSPNNAGQFYFPNGDRVRTRRFGEGIYRTRRSQHIRLNRESGVTTPTGVYRCEIPDASGVTQNIFISLTA